MIKVSILYPKTADSTFDMTYYLDKHIPMIREKLGAALKGTSVEQGIGGGQPGAPPAYVTMCHLMFDSVESFQQSFGPHTAVIASDVPNYTNTRPTVQVSEIKL